MNLRCKREHNMKQLSYESLNPIETSIRSLEVRSLGLGLMAWGAEWELYGT